MKRIRPNIRADFKWELFQKQTRGGARGLVKIKYPRGGSFQLSIRLKT